MHKEFLEAATSNQTINLKVIDFYVALFIRYYPVNDLLTPKSTLIRKEIVTVSALCSWH